MIKFEDFLINKIIKHNKFKDVACKVIKATKKKGYYNLEVLWYNLGQGSGGYLISTDSQSLSIKIEALKNWDDITESFKLNEELMRCN